MQKNPRLCLREGGCFINVGVLHAQLWSDSSGFVRLSVDPRIYYRVFQTVAERRHLESNWVLEFILPHFILNEQHHQEWQTSLKNSVQQTIHICETDFEVFAVYLWCITVQNMFQNSILFQDAFHLFGKLDITQLICKCMFIPYMLYSLCCMHILYIHIYSYIYLFLNEFPFFLLYQRCTYIYLYYSIFYSLELFLYYLIILLSSYFKREHFVVQLYLYNDNNKPWKLEFSLSSTSNLNHNCMFPHHSHW